MPPFLGEPGPREFTEAIVAAILAARTIDASSTNPATMVKCYADVLGELRKMGDGRPGGFLNPSP
jgi:hypothetical protein